MNKQVRSNLCKLQAGGCTCGTKTPELQYHNECCVYRIASEIYLLLEAEENDKNCKN